MDERKAMEVGKRIRRLRIRSGLTQQELADRSCYATKGAIAKIEKGERMVQPEKLEMIAEALNTTSNYLLHGDEAYNQELGSYQENREYISANAPELLPYLEALSNPKKRILFDKLKDLTPEDVESLLRVVRSIKND